MTQLDPAVKKQVEEVLEKAGVDSQQYSGSLDGDAMDQLANRAAGDLPTLDRELVKFSLLGLAVYYLGKFIKGLGNKQ